MILMSYEKNLERLSEKFRFQLPDVASDFLRSQFVISGFEPGERSGTFGMGIYYPVTGSYRNGACQNEGVLLYDKD